MARTGDHSLGVVARHLGGFATRRGRGDHFLHIHQAMTLIAAANT